MNEFEALVQRWLAGEADAEDQRRLHEAVQDPTRQEAVYRLCVEQRATRAALGGGVDVAALIAAQRRRTRRIWRFAGLTTAALLLIAVAVVSVVSRGPSASLQVEQVLGPAWVSDASGRRQLAAGRVLQADTRLEVAEQGAVLLRSAAGIEVRLEAGALLLHSKRQWHLDAGALAVSVDPSAGLGGLVVTTPHARCSITGTLFRLQVGSSGSVLAVEEGSVLWTPDGAESEMVRAGDYGMAPAADGLLDLLGFSFHAGAVDVSGLLAPGPRLRGIDQGEPTPTGMLIERSDLIYWQQLITPGRIPVLPLLRASDRVRLAARVRFHTRAPYRCSLGVLQCLAPDTGLERHLPLRWWHAAQPPGPSWHEVAVELDRTGARRSFINGVEVHQEEAPWPFALWTPAINLLIHTHRDPPDDPIDIEYAWIRLSVR